MAKLYRKPTIKWYKDQIGYSSGSSKSSKYSKELDSVNFYNTRKNGYTNWCAIFYDTGVYENAVDASVNEVRALVYEPNVDNCGAGCAQKIQYYKDAGRWYPHKVKGCPAQSGDEIFFGSSEYKSISNPLGAYHTGAVIDWDSNGLYTSEGNTNGRGDVSKRFYSYSDSRILGFGRPNWTADGPDDTPEPTPPEPAPTPAPSVKKYKVKTNGGTLSLRNEPKLTGSTVIANMPNGTVLDVTEIVKGETVNNNDCWAKTTYSGKTGYCTCSWLVPVTDGKQYTVSVNSFLNVRSGPGKNYSSVGRRFNGDIVTVYATSGEWGEIGEGKWVCMNYLV